MSHAVRLNDAPPCPLVRESAAWARGLFRCVLTKEENEKFIKEKNMENKKERYYIVRGDRSGVFAGNIRSREGREVTLANVRRLWYWDGAASLSQLALEGVKNPKNCKFTVTLQELTVLDAIELIPCTDEAEESIRGVREWKM